MFYLWSYHTYHTGPRPFPSFLPSPSECLSIVTAASTFPQRRMGDEPEKVTLQSLIRDTISAICLRVPVAEGVLTKSLGGRRESVRGTLWKLHFGENKKKRCLHRSKHESVSLFLSVSICLERRVHEGNLTSFTRREKFAQAWGCCFSKIRAWLLPRDLTSPGLCS